MCDSGDKNVATRRPFTCILSLGEWSDFPLRPCKWGDVPFRPWPWGERPPGRGIPMVGWTWLARPTYGLAMYGGKGKGRLARRVGTSGVAGAGLLLLRRWLLWAGGGETTLPPLREEPPLEESSPTWWWWWLRPSIIFGLVRFSGISARLAGKLAGDQAMGVIWLDVLIWGLSCRGFGEGRDLGDIWEYGEVGSWGDDLGWASPTLGEAAGEEAPNWLITAGETATTTKNKAGEF